VRGLNVTNHGAEVLVFYSQLGAFRADTLPLALWPGVTWIEAQLWATMRQLSEPLRAALESGAVSEGERCDRPIAAMHAQYDLQWPLPPTAETPSDGLQRFY
jgi:hypothetical protein